MRNLLKKNNRRSNQEMIPIPSVADTEETIASALLTEELLEQEYARRTLITAVATRLTQTGCLQSANVGLSLLMDDEVRAEVSPIHKMLLGRGREEGAGSPIQFPHAG